MADDPHAPFRPSMLPLALLCLLASAASSTVPSARTTVSLPGPPADLVVPLQDAPPRLRFHAGAIGPDGQPLLSPVLPSIWGPASSWYVAQWQQDSFLSPAGMRVLSPGHWRFAAPDDHSSVSIDRTLGRLSYTLSESGGRLTAQGGANLFLATAIIPGPANFGVPVELRIAARLVDADIAYRIPSAAATGAVQAVAFVGLGLSFQGTAPGLGRFVFMQLPIAVSRPVPPGPGVVCSVGPGGPALLYAPGIPPLLPFRRSPVAVEFHYDLSELVRDMLSRPYPCGGRLLDWPTAQRNPGAWRLTGLFVGLETQDRDLRPGAATVAPQGVALAALKIMALSVRRGVATGGARQGAPGVP